MAQNPKKRIAKESTSLLNTVFGLSIGNDMLEAPVTRSHRIKDKHVTVAGVVADFSEYKRIVIEFILKNPRSSVKDISTILRLPKPSVQSILSKSIATGEITREGLYEKKSCRPNYVYWIVEK